jgi:DNA-binding transcriptional ArsR family regulator
VTVDQLSSVFGALADPTRRAILARLAQGDLPVRELAAPFPMSQPAISRHLKVLEHAGLISRTRRATARLSHIEPEPLLRSRLEIHRNAHPQSGGHRQQGRKLFAQHRTGSPG